VTTISGRERSHRVQPSGDGGVLGLRHCEGQAREWAHKATRNETVTLVSRATLSHKPTLSLWAPYMITTTLRIRCYLIDRAHSLKVWEGILRAEYDPHSNVCWLSNSGCATQARSSGRAYEHCNAQISECKIVLDYEIPLAPPWRTAIELLIDGATRQLAMLLTAKSCWGRNVQPGKAVLCSLYISSPWLTRSSS
jgi:hypothetical protein